MGNVERLVLENDGLVWATVQRYRRIPGVVVEDLVAAGRVGLVIAASRFDPARASFSTFAVPWIRQCAARHVVLTRGLVVAPERQQQRLARAINLGEELDDYTRSALAARNAASIHRDDDDGDSVHEPFTDEQPIELAARHEAEAMVHQALASLDADAAEIVSAIYGLGRQPEPLKDIARRLHRCPTTIRRRARAALRVMQDALEAA